MEGEPLPSRTYNHVAFEIEDANHEDLLGRVLALGPQVRESRPGVEGEGRSIYF